MATEIAPAKSRSLNPLRFDGEALPVNYLLLGRIIAAVLLLRGSVERITKPFLPFLAIFDHLGPPQILQKVFQVVMAASCALVLLNRCVRPACAAIGATLIAANLANQTGYTQNNLFTGLVLILLSMELPGKPSLVRYQLAILYLCAGLNKLLDGDWRSGVYVDHWASVVLRSASYQHLAPALPGHSLATLIGWFVISAELGLGLAVLLGRRRALVIAIGVGFHVVLSVVSRNTYGMFLYAAPAAYLSLVVWPEAPLRVDVRPEQLTAWPLRWLRALDLDRRFTWHTERSPSRLQLTLKDRELLGARAALAMLALNPAVWLLLPAVVAILDRLLNLGASGWNQGWTRQ